MTTEKCVGKGHTTHCSIWPTALRFAATWGRTGAGTDAKHGQFGGRLAEIFFGRNLRAMTIASIAIGGVPASLLLLMLARGELWQLVAFTLLLGASQGVITIVRGAVPLALFGVKGYGAVLGLIAMPILLVPCSAGYGASLT